MSEPTSPKRKPLTPEEKRAQEIRNLVAEMFFGDEKSMSMSIEAVGPFAPPKSPSKHKSRLKRREGR